MKNFFLMLLFIFIIQLAFGCATRPYFNRSIIDENGDQIKYPFAYGKFCGPNYPKLATGKTSIDFWPPVDDLDTMCYAHDQCYALTFKNNHTCDTTMVEIIKKYFIPFSNSGCYCIASDIKDAFLSKPYSDAGDITKTVISDSMNITLGLGVTLISKAFSLIIYIFENNKGEGTCNIAELQQPAIIIKDFETLYYNSVFNKERQTINIPFGNLDNKKDISRIYK